MSSSLFLSTTDKLPFWLQANQYGEVPYESQFVQLKGSVKHEYDSLYTQNKILNKFSYGYGLTGAVNAGKINQGILSEAYAKVRLGGFELYAGRKKEIVGLVDSVMTAGSLIWSGNALPLPKVQISLPNYISITKNDLLSVKASFAHGWFGSADSVQNYYLHQKSIYLRIGRPVWKVKIYGGFNHQVQWAGKPVKPFYDQKTEQFITDFPSDLSTYLKVVTGTSLNKDLDAGQTKDGVPFNDAFNRAGNHLGTLDMMLEFELTSGFIKLYRSNIYEDGSLYYLNNVSDGLTGISYSSKNSLPNSRRFQLNGLNLEYLSTTNQGGSLSALGFIPEFRGVDNYFNNGIYQDGYTYKKRTIGTPFILPLTSYSNHFSESQLKIISPNYLVNNRINVLSLGALGKLDETISVMLRYSTSLNKGNYRFPISKKQNSFLVNITRNQKTISYRLSIAYDNGELLPNNFGGNVTIAKSFL
ncbi:capsule assembly Wzi family protein [uncultured Arcticibacterium sp.]|uniref:capsule assembly Wzi family protein n=1 Tax=uncultured Arcticibacterium sp. TaxID=2173042 RepID=UPI0030FD09D0